MFSEGKPLGAKSGIKRVCSECRGNCVGRMDFTPDLHSGVRGFVSRVESQIFNFLFFDLANIIFSGFEKICAGISHSLAMFRQQILG